MKITKLIARALPLLCLGACLTTQGGTDTGNPGGKVASALCGRVEQCHAGVPAGCAAAIKLTLDLPSDLDLEACRDAIQDISCSSDAMGDAWSSSEPANFDGVGALLGETEGACD